jgi:hypothetical protein
MMNAKTEAAVIKHGENLLLVFPGAAERDPVKLCRKLRKLEREGAALALRLCNGPEIGYEEADRREADILDRVNVLLGNAGLVPVFLNRDPRGYALKIRDGWMRAASANGNPVAGNLGAFRLHRDWGGYGIIAPDLTEK